MSTDTANCASVFEDMTARKLGRHSQRSHIHSCIRFAAFLALAGHGHRRRQSVGSSCS